MFKRQNISIYMMLWELVFHFYIGINIIGSKEVFVWHKKWAKYFFANLVGWGPIATNSPPLVEELKKCLEQFTNSERVLMKMWKVLVQV